MPKIAAAPQSRRHLLLRDDDWSFLTEHFGPDSPSKVGVGTAVREIVHRKVIELRARMDKATNEVLGERA